jgi:hypothetical protein
MSIEVSTGNIASGPADMMQNIITRPGEELPFKGQGFYCFAHRIVLIVKEPSPPQVARDLGATTDYFKAYQYRVPFEQTIFYRANWDSEFPRYDHEKEPTK